MLPLLGNIYIFELDVVALNDFPPDAQSVGARERVAERDHLVQNTA